MTEPDPFPSSRREARRRSDLSRREAQRPSDLSRREAQRPSNLSRREARMPSDLSRREARVLTERHRSGQSSTSVLARHARRRRAAGIRAVFALAASAALVVGGTSAVTAAVTAGMITEPGTSDTVIAAEAHVIAESPVVAEASVTDGAPASHPSIEVTVLPVPEEGLPAPTIDVTAAGTALCDDPAFVAALDSADDATVIAAAGGGAAFRTAVATGAAPCVPLDDPERAWVVVNKQRPYAPMDYAPAPLAMPEGVRSLVGGDLRADAAASLSALVAAAADAGVGELALESGYRSYTTQQTTYSGHVADRGAEGADLVSARPGYSEHQSGLGADLVACDGTCGTIDDLAATPQGAWLSEHAWEHGWIVRYVEGRTDVTGYLPEPWHVRYIGVDLARAYHEGGFTTLEEFFGLPSAPGYAG